MNFANGPRGVERFPLRCDLLASLNGAERPPGYQTLMPGSYAFAIDAEHKLLRINFSGFFRVEDLAGYASAKNVAITRLGCRPNEHVTLCDFTNCTPQSQAVLDLFTQSLDDPRYQSRRLAIVIGSVLGTMQAQRIVKRANTSFFQSVADAEHWLCDARTERTLAPGCCQSNANWSPLDGFRSLSAAA